jgi:plasmid stabilization system protein ParE
MVKKIVWTKRANSKFNKIVEYLEQEWGPGVTKSFIRRTYDVIELISDQSHL